MYEEYDGIDTGHEQLVGRVRRASNPDRTGMVRGAIQTNDGIISFLGPVAGIDVGMEATILGEFTEENRFTAYSFRADTSQNAGLRVLLSDRVKGCGPAKSTRYVADYRDDAVALLFEEGWEERLRVQPQARPFATREDLEAALYLYALGYPVRVIKALLKAYGKSASIRPRTAPYAYTIEGRVSFYIEDRVQKALGCTDTEARILAAGYELERWISTDMEGHTMYGIQPLGDKLAIILRVHKGQALAWFKDYLANQVFYPVRDQWAPAPLARAEVAIAAKVFGSKPLAPVTDLDPATRRLDDSQVSAIRNALEHQFSVITGGPGTGKTTTTKALVREATLRGYNVQLLAPTGKAARRLTQVTGIRASTIHRYLPIDWKLPQLALKPDVRCLEDLLIIDEASMVDSELLGLCLRFAANKQIVCVGDANQLPSVQPGAVLQDLINSPRANTTWLTQVHRSAQHSWMATQAPGILKGGIDLGATDDFQFIEARNLNHMIDLVVDRVRRYGSQDFQVLSPRRTGPYGTEVLNMKIQLAVHNKDTDPHTVFGDYLYFVNDPVVATSNDYDNGIFNGDLGRVTAVAPNAITVKYDFGSYGADVQYTGSELGSVQPGYALSIHRYQGSEAKRVVVLCHSGMGPTILTRRLLYTAVTRAKENLEIIGDKLGVRMAVSSPTPPRRTALGWFLENASDWPTRAKETL